MPEGPELALMSDLISRHGGPDRLYNRLVFSETILGNKGTRQRAPKLTLPKEWKQFTIQSTSSGKELIVTLTPIMDESSTKNSKAKVKPASTKKLKEEAEKAEQAVLLSPSTKKSGNDYSVLEREAVTDPIYLRFNMGMTGCWHFQSTSVPLPPHAHCMFYTSDNSSVLLWEDVRRFGSCQMVTSTNDWGEERGPDPLRNYHLFRAFVLQHYTQHSIFTTHTIAEILLDQRFFNGIGNYLRAEILHRADISPFLTAKDVLAHLPLICPHWPSPDVPKPTLFAYRHGPNANYDILFLCHQLFREVYESNFGFRDERSFDMNGFDGFIQWCQVFGVEGMKRTRDKAGRTIWHHPKHRVPKQYADDSTLHSPNKNKQKHTKNSGSAEEKPSTKKGQHVKAKAENATTSTSTSTSKRKTKTQNHENEPSLKQKGEEEATATTATTAAAVAEQHEKKKKKRGRPSTSIKQEIASQIPDVKPEADTTTTTTTTFSSSSSSSSASSSMDFFLQSVNTSSCLYPRAIPKAQEFFTSLFALPHFQHFHLCLPSLTLSDVQLFTEHVLIQQNCFPGVHPSTLYTHTITTEMYYGTESVKLRLTPLATEEKENTAAQTTSRREIVVIVTPGVNKQYNLKYEVGRMWRRSV